MAALPPSAAAAIDGVAKVLTADDAVLSHGIAENVAPLIQSLASGYTHLMAPATTTGKNIMPRVAALLDVMQVSDIIAVESADTFRRPIYAGNAIATVTSNESVKVVTVRGPELVGDLFEHREVRAVLHAAPA